MNKDAILTGAGVALGVVGAFLLGRSTAAKAAKDDVDEKKDEILENNPGMSEPQALVEAAADVTEEALDNIRNAEETAGVPENTTNATESEEDLEQAEKDALLDPTNEQLQRELAEAEAKAEADWAALIAAKKSAYESAIFDLEKSLAASKIAVDEYDKAYAEVVRYQNQLDDAKDKHSRLIVIRQELWVKGNNALADAYTDRINELVMLINGPYQRELQNALNEMTPLILNASKAISKTDDAIDLVAEYAREALNFELLQAMATRLTTVASSTRVKLAELAEHLES